MEDLISWKTLWGTCWPACRAVQTWISMHSSGTVLRCFQAVGGECSQGHSHAGGTMGRANTDSTVFYLGRSTNVLFYGSWQSKTLYGSLNSSLRETQHYFFVLSLFSHKFRCWIHITLASFFWGCGIQLLVLGSAEVLPVLLGLMCKARTGMSLLHQFCVWREYMWHQFHHVLSWLQLSYLIDYMLTWGESTLLEISGCHSTDFRAGHSVVHGESWAYFLTAPRAI